MTISARLLKTKTDFQVAHQEVAEDLEAVAVDQERIGLDRVDRIVRRTVVEGLWRQKDAGARRDVTVADLRDAAVADPGCCIPVEEVLGSERMAVVALSFRLRAAEE
jgi:hypothetical protein